MDKVYRPKGKPNKCEMPQRQGPYIVIGKVSSLAYKLDISAYTKIYPVISVVYFLRYRIHEDPYHYVLPSPGSIEYGSDFETSADEIQNGQHWKLEYIVDHHIKHDGFVKYLMRWKGY